MVFLIGDYELWLNHKITQGMGSCKELAWAYEIDWVEMLGYQYLRLDDSAAVKHLIKLSPIVLLVTDRTECSIRRNRRNDLGCFWGWSTFVAFTKSCNRNMSLGWRWPSESREEGWRLEGDKIGVKGKPNRPHISRILPINHSLAKKREYSVGKCWFMAGALLT